MPAPSSCGRSARRSPGTRPPVWRHQAVFHQLLTTWPGGPHRLAERRLIGLRAVTKQDTDRNTRQPSRLYQAARRRQARPPAPLSPRRPHLHGSRSLTARQEGPPTVNVPVLPQPEAFDPDCSMWSAAIAARPSSGRAVPAASGAWASTRWNWTPAACSSPVPAPVRRQGTLHHQITASARPAAAAVFYAGNA